MKASRYLKITLITLLIATTFAPVFAQQLPDYFITSKNDTVYCKLSESMGTVINKNFKYTTATITKPKKLTTDTVSEFSLNNVVYTKQLLPGESEKKAFVVWALRGKINLYKYDNTAYNSEAIIYYYIGKANGELLELRPGFKFAGRQDRLKSFYDMFADAPQIAAKFKADNDFSLEAFVRAITQYNTM